MWSLNDINLKCSTQIHQTSVIKMIEMKKQSLRGGQIANSSVRISDFVNKFQHHGKLFSEINVKSSNREPSTPTYIGSRITSILLKNHSVLNNSERPIDALAVK